MSFQIIINIGGTETTIDDDYIVQATSVVTNKTKFNFDDMIAATTEFILDGSDGLFNPDNPSSIFYGDDWYNQQVSIYNNDILVWNGLLKKIKYSGKNRRLSVKTKNYIQEIIDKECSLIRGTGSSEEITPAEIILEILTDWVELPDSAINKIGFNQGISYQESISAFIELRLGQENSTSSSDVILALCRITGAYIYAEDNIINYFQPTPYNGELGEEIKASDIIEKTFKLSYDDKEVVNYSSIFTKGVNNPTSVFLKNSPEYRFLVTITTTNGSDVGTVTYFAPTGTAGLPANAADYLKKGYLINNGDDATPSIPPYSTIVDFDIDLNTITFSENATQTGSDSFVVAALEPVNDTYLGNHVFDSFGKYDLKSYKLVKDTPSSDTDLINSHKIIFKSYDYADNVIGLKTLLNTAMKKYAEFTMDYNKNYIKLNDQLDLTFDYYIREPVRVITKKLDSTKKKISVKCEFINSPHEYYSRDVTKPENFPIFALFYDTNKIAAIWNNQDVNYYKLYFGSNDTYFDGVAAEGFSPLTISSPLQNNNNQNYQLLSGLTEYKYYMKATGTDASENESDYSNIPTPINIAQAATYEKRYKISGEIYSGLIAVSNLTGDEAGYLPPDPMTYYDELDYDEGTYSYVGTYETPLIGSDKGLDYIVWKASDFNNNIAIQYREYDVNTGVFGSWNPLKESDNRYFKFSLGSKKAVQFRIYLSNTTTTIYLENIKEVD